MKQMLLFALSLWAVACSAVPNPFPEGAALYDLRTGEALTPEKAAKAPAVYGTLQTRLFDSDQSYSFVRVNTKAYQLEVLTAEGEKADSTSALCLKHGAVAGINGSYFNMKNLTSTTYVKDDGFVVSTTTMRQTFHINGSVLIANDEFVIDSTPADSTWTGGETWREAMAAGPILIDEGEVIVYEEGVPMWKSFIAKRHPRSMIGTDAQGYLWLVVVDGRASGKADGMSIAELTELALQLGLTDALNLDGGGSSTLWTLPGGVINHPCDNGQFDNEGQRIVPNALLVKAL